MALFVRRPVPGQVKTRLARDIGKESACDLYQAMVKDTLNSITANKLPVYLFHDGADSEGLPKEWTDSSCAVIAQNGDSLDARMATAFELLFANRVGNVALLGSDIPGLDAVLLATVFRSLENSDSVIVPAFDGGYCLIALNRKKYNKRIFQDIAWSTESVLKSTLEKIAHCGLRVTVLESRQDIDTCDDLEAYCHNQSEPARATNQWLENTGYAL